jgi:hypothetical protein
LKVVTIFCLRFIQSTIECSSFRLTCLIALFGFRSSKSITRVADCSRSVPGPTIDIRAFTLIDVRGYTFKQGTNPFWSIRLLLTSFAFLLSKTGIDAIICKRNIESAKNKPNLSLLLRSLIKNSIIRVLEGVLVPTLGFVLEGILGHLLGGIYELYTNGIRTACTRNQVLEGILRLLLGGVYELYTRRHIRTVYSEVYTNYTRIGVFELFPLKSVSELVYSKVYSEVYSKVYSKVYSEVYSNYICIHEMYTRRCLLSEPYTQRSILKRILEPYT